MDTQNTPIHIRIWSRHFWMLVLANLLLGVSVFMLLPYIPAQMQADGYTLRDVGLVMLAFGLGIVIPGPYVSYFIERFRRNKVCLLSILLLVVFSAILYEADVQKVFHIGFSGTLAVRVLQAESIIKDGDPSLPIVDRNALEGKGILSALSASDIPVVLDERGKTFILFIYDFYNCFFDHLLIPPARNFLTWFFHLAS